MIKRTNCILYLFCVIVILVIVVSAQEIYNCEPYSDGSPRKYGDLDGNGVIEINDSRIFFEFMVNNSLIPGDKGCLDIDKNGVVDFEDNRILNENIDNETEIGVYVPSGSQDVGPGDGGSNGGDSKKAESESGGRRIVSGGGEGQQKNVSSEEENVVVETIEAIKELKKESPVLFWVIIVILIVLIIGVSSLLVFFFIKWKKEKNISNENAHQGNFSVLQDNVDNGSIGME